MHCARRQTLGAHGRHHGRPLEGWREGETEPRTLLRLEQEGAHHAVPRPVRTQPRALQHGGRARQPHRAAANAYIERAGRRVADHLDRVHRGGDPLTVDGEQLVEAADASRRRRRALVHETRHRSLRQPAQVGERTVEEPD
jgi:hypothetical protein